MTAPETIATAPETLSVRVSGAVAIVSGAVTLKSHLHHSVPLTTALKHASTLSEHALKRF